MTLIYDDRGNNQYMLPDKIAAHVDSIVDGTPRLARLVAVARRKGFSAVRRGDPLRDAYGFIESASAMLAEAERRLKDGIDNGRPSEPVRRRRGPYERK